jgi:uncharacterized caspase-like protein
MLRILCGCAVFLVSLSLAAPFAHAERFALLIGNQSYNDAVGPLRNPHNDIAVVGKALTEVGFELLPPRKDATRDQMLFAVYELADRMRKAGPTAIGFVYYAGHGVAVGDENVLIPINVENTSDAMLSVRGVRLGEILDILNRDAPEAVTFVVLDACRNLRGQRGERGFVAVGHDRTGVVIAFSTAAGRTATDEGAKSTPFAAALAEEIVKPGRNDQAVFNAVRARVRDATRNRTPPQTPWVYDGLVGERVVFKRAALAVPPPKTAASSGLSEAGEAWAVTKDTTSVGMLEVFIRRFGDTYYGELAKLRLAELKRAESAETAKAQADRDRLALLQQEENRKRADAQAARKKADDDARAKAEADRQIVTHTGHIREAQERLYELNYDPGPADGRFTSETEQAVREFEAQLGVPITGKLTMGLLERMKSAGNLAPWGAIVYSESTQNWGMSWDHASRKAAVAAAQASCGTNPASCSKALTFFGSGCGAFAHSQTRWSLVARDRAASARQAALVECQKQGARCSIVASVCADGENRTQ